MPRTSHHDLINKDYFGKIKYIKELESSLNKKLTKSEKGFIEDTFRTLIIINNQWASNDKSDVSFKKNKDEIKNYIQKHKKSYQKSPDTYCIDLYNKFEEWFVDMEEKEQRNLDKLCNNIKSEITQILEKLDYINFDYDYNGYFYYKRNPSNKTKRHYVSLLDSRYTWSIFVNEYNENHLYIQLSPYFSNTNGQDYIRCLYRTYADLSLYLKNEEYDDCLKTIIRLSFKNSGLAIKQDNKLSTWRDKLEEIANMILNKEYDEAYKNVIKFIDANKQWYARAS